MNPVWFFQRNHLPVRCGTMRAASTTGRVVMSVLKVTNIGNSTGVILPDEILERLRVKRGAIETKNGIELTANNPALIEQIDIAERVMQEDQEALRN